MSKYSKYEKLKKQALKVFDDFEQSVSEGPIKKQKQIYDEWLALSKEALLNHFQIVRIDDLEQFAEEGISCIERMDKAHDANPEYFPGQHDLAVKIYKKAEKHVYNLSKANGWRPLQRNQNKLHTIIELRAIQKWCIDCKMQSQDIEFRDSTRLKNPIPCKQVADIIHKRSDNVARTLRNNEYPLEKISGKWFCDAEHAAVIWRKWKKYWQEQQYLQKI